MLFNSPVFIFAFLPLVLAAYFVLARVAGAVAARVWLALSSLFFYAWWDYRFLALIGASILGNYALGVVLARTREDTTARGLRRRRVLLMAGIVANVALLAYYKYADFLIANLNQLAGTTLSPLQLALPLAISFFTFQQIAYLVDCHSTRVRDFSLAHYTLFVTFFPHLIAGPIVHHAAMMPQFDDVRAQRADADNIARGLFIFAMGLCKKVLIADTLAQWVAQGFGSAAPPGFVEAWAASLAYTFQLYFDFSGYSDMAIGAALMFNIRLPVNFDSPLRARSIRDFWRRWHITLSSWLRDYVYVPLGGNRRGEARVCANLFVTFLLGGLWHGAGWTFVLWGALHGAALVLHRGWRRLGGRMPAWCGWLLTFLFVNAAFVVFRADSVARARGILAGMIGANGFAMPDYLAEPLNRLGGPTGWAVTDLGESSVVPFTAALALLACALIALRASNALQIGGYTAYQGPLAFRRGPLAALFIGAVLCFALLAQVQNAPSEFLYFNF